MIRSAENTWGSVPFGGTMYDFADGRLVASVCVRQGVGEPSMAELWSVALGESEWRRQQRLDEGWLRFVPGSAGRWAIPNQDEVGTRVFVGCDRNGHWWTAHPSVHAHSYVHVAGQLVIVGYDSRSQGASTEVILVGHPDEQCLDARLDLGVAGLWLAPSFTPDHFWCATRSKLLHLALREAPEIVSEVRYSRTKYLPQKVSQLGPGGALLLWSQWDQQLLLVDPHGRVPDHCLLQRARLPQVLPRPDGRSLVVVFDDERLHLMTLSAEGALIDSDSLDPRWRLACLFDSGGTVYLADANGFAKLDGF